MTLPKMGVESSGYDQHDSTVGFLMIPINSIGAMNCLIFSLSVLYQAVKQPSFVSPPARCCAASVVCFAYKFVSITNISTSSVKYNLKKINTCGIGKGNFQSWIASEIWTVWVFYVWGTHFITKSMHTMSTTPTTTSCSASPSGSHGSLHPDPTPTACHIVCHFIITLFRFIVTCIIHKKFTSSMFLIRYHFFIMLHTVFKLISNSFLHHRLHLCITYVLIFQWIIRQKSIIQTIFYTCIFEIILTACKVV